MVKIIFFWVFIVMINVYKLIQIILMLYIIKELLFKILNNIIKQLNSKNYLFWVFIVMINVYKLIQIILMLYWIKEML